MHKEKKRIDFGFRNCWADATSLTLTTTCCYGYGGIDNNIDGLHAGLTRTSPKDFEFLVALGNCHTCNILVYHGSESPFNQTSSYQSPLTLRCWQQVSWRSMDEWAYPFHSKPRCIFKWLCTTLRSLICLIVLDLWYFYRTQAKMATRPATVVSTSARISQRECVIGCNNFAHLNILVHAR